MQVRQFIEEHFHHFNAAATLDAARAYESHIKSGGQMLVTLAGAMSTGAFVARSTAVARSFA